MKVIIAGSRGIHDMKLIEKAIAQSGFDITEVVCGEAAGADTLGRYWAERQRIPVQSFPASWNDIAAPGAVIKTNARGQYNARAGHDRNFKMAKYADALIAAWDGCSAGTKDMIALMKREGKPIYVEKP